MSSRLGVAALFLVALATTATPGARDGGSRAQLAITRASAPLAHSNSRDGRAILTVASMSPGERRTGEVVIRAGGATSVALRTRVTGPLASRLHLAIAGVWRGPLTSAPACLSAGTIGAGGARTYRFTVTFERGSRDNAHMGQAARADFEWRDRCGAPPPPVAPRDAEPPSRGTYALGDLRLAIGRGPYRFARRGGTARVGVRCLASDTGTCRGRLELERWKGGQGKGIAMAVGRFTVPAGGRRRVKLALNPRARRRIRSKRSVRVRAYVTATDASGRRHRVAYRDRLVFRGR